MSPELTFSIFMQGQTSYLLHAHSSSSCHLFSLELGDFGPEVFLKALKLVMQTLASFTDSLIRLDISVGLDTHLDLFLKRVRLLVACEAYPCVTKQFVSDHIAKRMILLVHVDGRCVLPAGVIHALDQVAWLQRYWLSSCICKVLSCKSHARPSRELGHGTVGKHLVS